MPFFSLPADRIVFNARSAFIASGIEDNPPVVHHGTRMFSRNASGVSGRSLSTRKHKTAERAFERLLGRIRKRDLRENASESSPPQPDRSIVTCAPVLDQQTTLSTD
jgi:hypothetical protein